MLDYSLPPARRTGAHDTHSIHTMHAAAAAAAPTSAPTANTCSGMSRVSFLRHSYDAATAMAAEQGTVAAASPAAATATAEAGVSLEMAGVLTNYQLPLTTSPT